MIQAGAWQDGNHRRNVPLCWKLSQGGVGSGWRTLGESLREAAGKPSYGSKRNEGVGEHVRIEIQPEAPVNCGHEIRNVRRALTPFCRVGYRNEFRRLSDRLS